MPAGLWLLRCISYNRAGAHSTNSYISIDTHTHHMNLHLMPAMAGPLHGPHPKSESNSSWQYLRKQTNQSQLKMETLRCVCNVYQYLVNFFSSLILFIRFICFANSFDERKINSNKNICTKNNNI